MKITGSEPATGFGFEGGTTVVKTPGLTIRQHYAGLAMQGILANDVIGKRYDEYAKDAVNMADWLIYELNKDKNV